jgi:hypothetical protein
MIETIPKILQIRKVAIEPAKAQPHARRCREKIPPTTDTVPIMARGIAIIINKAEMASGTPMTRSRGVITIAATTNPKTPIRQKEPLMMLNIPATVGFKDFSMVIFCDVILDTSSSIFQLKAEASIKHPAYGGELNDLWASICLASWTGNSLYWSFDQVESYTDY